MEKISDLFFVLLIAVMSTSYLSLGFGGLTIRSSTSSSYFSGVMSSKTGSSTAHFMFGGSGVSPLEEDEDLNVDPEKESQLEATAKAMGISVKEYKLILKSQENMQKALNALRVSGGNSGTVTVEMDGNSPPKYLKVSVTDDGKALGKAALEKEIVTALKQAGEAARKGQADVMKQMQEDIAKAYKVM